MKSYRLLLAGLCVLAASCANAVAPGAKTYIGAAHLDATKFLAPLPAPASDAQRADLAAVQGDQSLKNTPRWALAQSDDNVSPYTAFASVLGPDFTKARTPHTGALFEILFNDVKSQTGPAKDAFARPRPPLLDPQLETCKPLEQTKSYPSGHAARGWMMALVLAEMVPEKANALLERGRDYGDSRIVCAEHFPSDVQAGRLVGAAVFAAAKNDRAFMHDYLFARREVRAALGLH